uniref:SFRICE_024544 n=1 Tax=Spodoptera frugiperda TaxID=7108 RepID=A0A2H1WC20_SPOFR
MDPSSVHTTNMSDNSECPDGTGPYIPISECITGVRAQDEQRHFTFEERNIIVNTRGDGHQYTSHPQIRVNAELSENDSNLSEDDDGSLHASHQNLPDWSVTKTFTKLSIASKKNGPEEGPPVPPRPPKTFAGRSRDTLTKDPFQGPKIQEPTEVVQEPPQHSHQRLRVPRRMSQGAPSSPRSLLNARCPEEEEDFSPSQSALQYCNLPSLPPAVDRALKPRHSSVSIGQYNAFMAQGTLRIGNVDDIKQDALQYLDLDLHPAKPAQTTEKTEPRKRAEIAHGRSMTTVDTDAYKTVDFLKTEAFNITRQDAEASRSFQY